LLGSITCQCQLGDACLPGPWRACTAACHAQPACPAQPAMQGWAGFCALRGQPKELHSCPSAQPPELHSAHLELLPPRQALVAKRGAVAGEARGQVGIQPQCVPAAASSMRMGSPGLAPRLQAFGALRRMQALAQATASSTERGSRTTCRPDRTCPAPQSKNIQPAARTAPSQARLRCWRPAHPPAPPTAIASALHHWK
jgi:hypothetical protein